jgi:cephalosporin hydroxylase
MNVVKMLPLPLRDRFRPAWRNINRRWAESKWSAKPEAWRVGREHVHRESDVDRLLSTAGSEFGITQVRSEITALLERLRAIAPQTVVEIGTHKGGNSFMFCHALASVKCVVGVDLCVQNAPKLIHFARQGQVYRALHGDSQTQQMLDRVKSQLHGRPVDFLFIDGDHSYRGVRTDFELYSPLVRKGGIIALHDIVPDHRTRFGKDTGSYAGEVYKLWGELKQRYDCEEIVNDAEQDGFGIGVVRI